MLRLRRRDGDFGRDFGHRRQDGNGTSMTGGIHQHRVKRECRHKAMATTFAEERDFVFVGPLGSDSVYDDNHRLFVTNSVVDCIGENVLGSSMDFDLNRY